MSDGSLNPEELVSRAKSQGVEYLALTDHDTIAGFERASQAAKMHQIQLISGIELSSEWMGMGIHVVGLNFDPNSPQMSEGIAQQKRARTRRAEIIADRLAKKGFANTLEGARTIAIQQALGDSDKEPITKIEEFDDEDIIIARPHFAKYLVEAGHVSSEVAAFKKYLGAGKVGDVKQCWPDLETVIDWIVSSGGIAVLAHPLHYKMTNTKLRRLVNAFKEAGGQAIEVVSGLQTSTQTNYLASIADEFDLFASAGSDFHHPNLQWQNLGQCQLPKECRPVPVFDENLSIN